MGEARKRAHNQMANDAMNETQYPELHSRQRRSRHRYEYKDSSTFDQLDDYYNYILDPDDILEDYLEPQKLRKIKPLVLDTSNGSWENVVQYSCGDVELRSRTNVLLVNGTFLRIQDILMDSDTGDIVLRGQRFLRTSRLCPILDAGSDEKELFWDLKDVKGSPLCIKGQSLVDVPLRMVERTVNLHLSNYEKSDDIKTDAFFCRWKLTRYYQDSKDKRRSIELAIERLRPSEADREFRLSDEILKLNWRGNCPKDLDGGTYYTALDGFCCSGGWSRGATMAGGVRVVRSFDLEEKACKSYGTNFPETNCLNVDVFDYCLPQRLSPDLQELATSPEYIDIAHYSTPCQFFSPAHTRVGVNDEKNFAASFCLANLLEKDKPRVVTFENTFGLERRHFPHLKAIFGQITSKGYSLRFSTLNLANWGIPQERQRLIMLASCPGEPLPTFPAPTHSCDGELPGTLRWVTALEAIKGIPFEGWQNHFPTQMKKRMSPANSRAMARTFTCKGNGDVHPDGRDYTICESQLLQGFPLHHRFARGLSRAEMLRQVGNAFPPLFVQKLVRHIRKQLQKVDGISESIDEDEFMSTEEVREWEIGQFLLDHENLPEGTRANVYCSDTSNGLGDDDNDMEGLIAKEEETEVYYSTSGRWITDSTDQRPASSGSDSSSSSLSSSSVWSVNNRFSRLNNTPHKSESYYGFDEMLASCPWYRLSHRPSTSTSHVRNFNPLNSLESMPRVISMPTRTRLVTSRSSSPDILKSPQSNAVESGNLIGNSMGNPIELDSDESLEEL